MLYQGVAIATIRNTQRLKPAIQQYRSSRKNALHVIVQVPNGIPALKGKTTTHLQGQNRVSFFPFLTKFMEGYAYAVQTSETVCDR